MGSIKVATFNVEWMVRLFEKGADTLVGTKSKTNKSDMSDAEMVCGRLAGVIRAIDPDVLFVQEGPPLQSQLEAFVKGYLDDGYETYSMPDGQQSNHAIVRKGLGLKIEQVPKTHAIYKHLARKLEYFTWGEVKKATMQDFTRRPVVLSLDFGDSKVELMGFHTKSKISTLKNKKYYTSADRPKMIDALKSRQKLSAEMSAVRRYLTHAILSKRVGGVILVGDLNDGPHRDVFEEKFLIHSIVDELRGAFHREVALMQHALPQEELVGKNGFTAEFNDPTRDGKLVKTLLDHIMVSPSLVSQDAPLRLRKGSGRIEHEAYLAQVEKRGAVRHQRPSDHRPVSVVFDF